MTDTAAPTLQPAGSSKRDPGKLDLRAAPRRVVRFKRGLVIGAAALGSGAILSVTMMALQGPALRIQDQAEEIYNTERRPTPDGLAALPGDYSQVKPEAPQLGPPLPGDLGRPILERQRQLGIAPGGPELSAEEQRLAQQAIQAKEAGVFFRIENRQNTTEAVENGQEARTQLATVASPDANRLALDPERDQNNQQRKLDFLNQRDTGGIYNPHVLQTPVSPYQVMAGSVIAASLITRINSDLPGLVAAQVTEDVYDTVTGRTLLIPQGARLIGTYDSVIAFGQSRALLVWQRIILPDGSSVEIDNLPATDTAGYAGLEDEVDYHTWRLIKGIALATLLGVGTERNLGSDESDPGSGSGLVRVIRESTQQNVNRAGQRITEKNLNIQPTITVRPGWPLRVIVHRDLVLRPLPRLKGSIMTNLKLGKLPDRTPAKITITVNADLNQALRDYGTLYRATYGEAESVAELIPFMPEAFLDSDRAFAKARKESLPETDTDKPTRRARSAGAGDTAAASPAVPSPLQLQE